MKILKELTRGDTGFALMLIAMASTILMLAFQLAKFLSVVKLLTSFFGYTLKPTIIYFYEVSAFIRIDRTNMNRTYVQPIRD